MAKKKRAVNKSQKIRDYLAKHPEAGPTAVARALKRYGVAVSLVSAIKGKSQTGRRKKRRAKAAKRSVRGRKGARRRQSAVEPVIAAAELIRECGGIEEARAALATAGKVAATLQ